MIRTKTKPSASGRGSSNPKSFTFFKDKKTDKPFVLTVEQVQEKFDSFLTVKKLRQQFLKSTQTIAVFFLRFVTSKEGLNSSMELTAYDTLEKVIIKSYGNKLHKSAKK